MPEDRKKVELILPGDSKRFNIVVTSIGFGVAGDDIYSVLSGHLNLVWGLTDSLRSVTFHVANFSWCNGNPVQDSDTGEPRRARILNQTIEDWAVTIDSVPDYSLAKEDELEKHSGNAITHVGVIEKRDHSPFSVKVYKHS